jgi:hypothetical protein
MFSSKRMVAIGVPVTLALVSLVFLSSTLNRPSDAQSFSFIFTAAGDYGSGTDAGKVLGAMGNTGANLNLALGDLSYGDKTPETAWCDFVKQRVGDTAPFEIVAGNHDDDTPSGYNINNFVLCLPDRIGNVVGTYGKEYYFDYPPVSPLMRVIMISPNLHLDGSTYDYSVGTAHYDWVAQTIDAARASGIQWIVVGMHYNCLSIGQYSCVAGRDIFNLLVEKKVDLILSGHDHTYQRTKQLATHASCSSVTTGSYNPACVVDDGADGVYSKEAGSIIMLAGTGGRDLYDINKQDSEKGYFVSWMGGNVSPTKGFVKFTVSSSQLQAQFIAATSGSFTDAFTITANQATPFLIYLPYILK